MHVYISDQRHLALDPPFPPHLVEDGELLRSGQSVRCFHGSQRQKGETMSAL